MASGSGAGGRGLFAVLRCLVPLAGGVAYWQVVALVAGVAEPWDAGAYWRLWYPVSLLLSVAAGLFVRRPAWLAGALPSLAQLPVTWWHAGFGPLWPIGVGFALILAVPAAIAAMLAARVAASHSG